MAKFIPKCGRRKRLFNPLPRERKTLRVDAKEMELSESESDDEEQESRMYFAITTDNVSLIKQLIQDGVSPNYKFKGENQLDKSLLHLACEQGQYECALCLLEAGARPFVIDAWYQNPITYCVCTGRDNMVELMVSPRWYTELHIDQKDKFGKSALQYAVANKYLNILDILVSAGADINTRDEIGHTALWSAMMEDGNIEIVKYLIEHGADVDQIDKSEKRTPLQIAILHAKEDVFAYCKMLIDAGAMVNTMDAFGHTAIISVMRRNRQDGATVQDIDLKLAELILGDSRFYVNLNSRTRHWYQFKGTALKMAVERGALPFVELLLAHRADTEICDEKGYTPLFLAGIHNKADIVRALLAYNSKMNVSGEVKYRDKVVHLSLFKYAILMEYWEVAEVLVMAGYDLSREEYLSTNEDVPDTLVLNFDFWSWLVQFRINPKCLRFLCRDVVRELLGEFNVVKVNALPLPQRLRDTLMFKNSRG